MKSSFKLIQIFVLIACAASPAFAMNPGDHVNDFRLSDDSGKSHDLYSLANEKAVVLMVQGNGCPIVRQAVPALRALRDQYKDKGVEVLLINSNLQDSREDIAKESKDFAFNIPVLVDNTQLIGSAFGFTRTAEVFVIDPKTWKLAYRGPIDDSLSYEKQHPATHHYTKVAIDDVLAGKPVKDSLVNGAGCLINIVAHDHKGSQT